ncbi:MAG: hypothetical protein GQ540_10155 [Lutibacter sp.]|uniref:hypothetical protein n=1 Tax=Lutibacter sp. TaxID=1925666 RepID=UPI0019DE3F4B|nr:hypothetical protein [Lutibacter sp.]NOR28873.1 hypothetical protein [Lutibacter sp.]
MKLKYKIYPKKKLLVEIISGTFNFTELKTLFEKLSADEQFMQFDKVLTNVAQAKFKISIFEVNEYIKFVKNMTKEREVKWGIITSKPKATALSMLITFDPFFRKNTKVFSTLEASIKFLNIDFEKENFLENDYIIIDF